MNSLHFEREYRTPHSEGYLVLENDHRLGRLELHFTQDAVFGTLIVEREMSESEVLDLIERVDDELVTSAQVAREDFVVTVYQGREIGAYSDESFEAEENEEE